MPVFPPCLFSCRVFDVLFVDFGRRVGTSLLQNSEKLCWRNGLHNTLPLIVTDIGGDYIVGSDVPCTTILKVVLKISESGVSKGLPNSLHTSDSKIQKLTNIFQLTSSVTFWSFSENIPYN